MFDRYKLDQLDIMLNDLQTDEYALARLKSDNSKAINLDEGALELLMDYYSGNIMASTNVRSKYVKAYTNPYFDGNDWSERPYKLYLDGEMQTFTQYFRDVDGYRVEITPMYYPKTDFFGYEVSFFNTKLGSNIEPTTTEVFETFYDAMDFVDSGELAHYIDGN